MSSPNLNGTKKNALVRIYEDIWLFETSRIIDNILFILFLQFS